MGSAAVLTITDGVALLGIACAIDAAVAKAARQKMRIGVFREFISVLKSLRA
jgi:hypothetical protein